MTISFCMNELSEIDKALLETIKRNIENRAGLPPTDNLGQKDYDFLQYFIQEFTGEALSLTTIKRIWKNDFQRLPHLSTLDILSKLACNQDWHTAKKHFVESKARDRRDDQRRSSGGTKSRMAVKGMRKIRVKLLAAAGIMILAGAALYYLPSLAPIDASGVKFSAEPTFDLQIPNSVVFSYDVKSYRAKHFFIQQSWDPARKVEVSAVNSKQTDIYYEPGYHYAKLLADDEVLKEIPVHIRYNDWFVRIRYPDSRLVKVANDDLQTEGYLGLKDEYAERLAGEDRYQLGFMLSKDFNLSADEFQLKASIRFDSLNANPCPTVNILIKGDNRYSWITLGNRGCESNLGLIVGDVSFSGKTNDLSALGLDAFAWQDIGVRLKDGKFQLLVNNGVVFESDYSSKLGELKEVDFFFNGIGCIDDINISDNQNNSFLSQNFN